MEVERVTVGPIARGDGHVDIAHVDIAHGRFPVPAPATLELLRGFDIVGGPRPGELTTPSGGAVVAALAETVETIPRMRMLAAGRGAVHRDGDERLLSVLVGAPA